MTTTCADRELLPVTCLYYITPLSDVRLSTPLLVSYSPTAVILGCGPRRDSALSVIEITIIPIILLPFRCDPLGSCFSVWLRPAVAGHHALPCHPCWIELVLTGW
jgi:hypothetical protein